MKEYLLGTIDCSDSKNPLNGGCIIKCSGDEHELHEGYY